MLGTLNGDGSPNLMPLWYDWDGEKLMMFSDFTVGKIGVYVGIRGRLFSSRMEWGFQRLG